MKRLNSAGIGVSLVLAAVSCGNTEQDVQLDEPVVTAQSALGSGATVTYLGKVSDVSDFSPPGLNLGFHGFYFPQFGQNETRSQKTMRNNMVFSRPTWQKDWEWKVFERCGGEWCNLASPDAGIFDLSEGEEGIGVETRTRPEFHDLTLPGGQVGNSGSTRDEAANGNSNNSINHISMQSSAPAEFCMSILTDNSDGHHNPNEVLQGRIGWYPDQDYEAGTAEVPANDLVFNNVPDLYVFKFSNMTGEDFIKIRMRSANESPGFGGLMFDSCASFPNLPPIPVDAGPDSSGVGGSAGAGAGGTAGSAGMGGGAAGAAGAAGSAGTPGVGGSAGTAGSGTGGAAGGPAGSGGTPGTGAMGGSGGSSGTGGPSAVSSADESGCGCAVPGSQRGSGLVAILTALFMLALRR